MALDDKTRTELEAAVFRHLVEHLRDAHRRAEYRHDESRRLLPQLPVELDEGGGRRQGVPMSKDQSREAIYGMPFDEWKAKYQKEASKEQQAQFDKAHKH